MTLGEKMKIMEKRHILIGGVALIKGRLRNDGMAMVRVCDSLEPAMVSWLSAAPFDTVSLIVRYGTNTTDDVEIGRINRRYSELPVAVQVALSELQAAQSDEASLDSVFRHHALRALREVGIRYSLGLPPERT